MAVPRRTECLVSAVIDHGAQVYTVRLQPLQPVPAFRPGQFLHLALDPFDPGGFWPESRVFSIASSPNDLAEIGICYAVKGRFTARMAIELASGSRVWIKMPYGDFTVRSDAPAILLAGGTGVTAFTAFLRGLASDNLPAVRLVYGARAPDLLIFHDVVRETASRVPGFAALCLAEVPGTDSRFKEDKSLVPGRIGYAAGRMSLDFLTPLAATAADAVWYLSGPPAMIRALSDGLRQAGIPGDRVRNDAWD